jgi:hypothetical protein
METTSDADEDALWASLALNYMLVDLTGVSGVGALLRRNRVILPPGRLRHHFPILFLFLVVWPKLWLGQVVQRSCRFAWSEALQPSTFFAGLFTPNHMQMQTKSREPLPNYSRLVQWQRRGAPHCKAALGYQVAVCRDTCVLIRCILHPLCVDVCVCVCLCHLNQVGPDTWAVG